MKPGRGLAILALAAAAACKGAMAGDRIQVGTNRGDSGAKSISVDVSITNERPINAFSLAIAYDREILTLAQITDAGTATATTGAQFFSPTINNASGQAVLGVIFGYSSEPYDLALPASPDAFQKVAVLTFDIAEGAPPGDYAVELSDGLGSPPVSNIFSVAGVTVRPALQDGAVTVINKYVMLLENLKTRPGMDVEVKCYGKHPETLQGFTIAFTYDKSVFTFKAASVLATDAALAVRPQTIEFSIPLVNLDYSDTLARISLGAVVDYVPPFTGHEIPASPSEFKSLARFTFSTSGSPDLLGSCRDLAFRNGDETTTNNMFIVNRESFQAAMIDGKVCFDAAPLFRRGRINSDAKIDISDGIVLLSYLFLGGASPGCLATGDINDDGRVDLSDTIALFTYLFLGGKKPPDPFDACGSDPEHAISCQSFPECQ